MFLSEGIAHLEDLGIDDFIRTVKNISTMQATEKLDGANLWFGLDDTGAFFTSREGKKKGSRFYSAAEYPDIAAYNGFRAAHQALVAKEDLIKQFLLPGDKVEIEVIYGRQPNLITYGAGGRSYIAFIRGVEGTPAERVDRLARILSNQLVKIRSRVIDSVDGERIDAYDAEAEFQFVSVQKFDSRHLKRIDVSQQLASLERFLRQKTSLPGRPSNYQVLVSPVTAFGQPLKEPVRRLKAEIEAQVMAGFKLPIKRQLLDQFVKKLRSPLSVADPAGDEVIGIEGVVLHQPAAGELVKLVDRDTFTVLNKFNQAVRAKISGTVKTTDMSAPLEVRGGIMGELKILVADLLGNKSLARAVDARRVLRQVAGATPEATIINLSNELTRFNDYRGLRRKVEALADGALEKLRQLKEDFVKNKDSYRLRLKDGRVMGLTPEAVKRTMVAFAEAKRDIDQLKQQVRATERLEQLVALLYGQLAIQVHRQGEIEARQVAEAVSRPGCTGAAESLLERRIFTDRSLYAGKDAWTIFNIYFSTYMMAAVIIKAHDMPGIRLLRDKTHMRLRAWSKEMSPFNFWGYPIWRASSPAVKKLVGAKTAGQIFKVARHVPPMLWKLMHIDISFGKEVPIEWHEHRKLFWLLQKSPGMMSDRINNLLDGVMRYEELTHDQKIKLHEKLFYYVMQFNQNSPLLTRIRAIYGDLLNSPADHNRQLAPEMKLMRQVATLAETESSGEATAAGAVAGAPAALFGEKGIIYRIKRNNWRPKKFPRPTPEKEKS